MFYVHSRGTYKPVHTFVQFIVIIVIARVFTYYSTAIIIPIRDIIRKQFISFFKLSSHTVDEISK